MHPRSRTWSHPFWTPRAPPKSGSPPNSRRCNRYGTSALGGIGPVYVSWATRDVAATSASVKIRIVTILDASRDAVVSRKYPRAGTGELRQRTGVLEEIGPQEPRRMHCVQPHFKYEKAVSRMPDSHGRPCGLLRLLWVFLLDGSCARDGHPAGQAAQAIRRRDRCRADCRRGAVFCVSPLIRRYRESRISVCAPALQWRLRPQGSRCARSLPS